MSAATTTWCGGLVGIQSNLDLAERRRTARYEVRGSAEAVIRRTDGSAALTAIELVDSSATGLGLLSNIEAFVGDEIAIHWNHGPIAGRRGTVCRCERVELEPGKSAFRIGLRSSAVAAA